MLLASEALAPADAALEAVLRLGAEEAEAYVELERGVTLQVHGGECRWVRIWDSGGVGLRAFRDGRLGYAYSSDRTGPGIGELAAAALENATANDPDVCNRLPEPPAGGFAELDLAPAAFEAATTADKVAVAARAERAALGIPHVERVVAAEYGDGRRQVAIASSRGVRGAYPATSVYVRVEAVADDGREAQAAQAFGLGRELADLDADEIGREAGARAAALLGGRGAPTGTMAAVLAPLAGAQLTVQLARLLSGEAVVKGRSALAGLAGELVAPEFLSLVDDPLLAGGPNSRPFDAEGVASRRTTLVGDGRLRGFLHNTYTGLRSGAGSTSSARRSSYRATPEVGASNVVIAPGERTEEELVRLAGDGLYVDELLGLQSSSPVSGRFSVGVSGRRIRGGELAEAVTETTIAASYLDVLRGVVALGNRLRFFPGSQAGASPALLLGAVAVAGTARGR